MIDFLETLKRAGGHEVSRNQKHQEQTLIRRTKPTKWRLNFSKIRLGVENGHSRHPKWPRAAPIQMDRKCILPTL
jgi:hypothetical protein